MTSGIEWRDVVGYEGLYSVSNTGLVKSIERKRWNGVGLQTVTEKILKPYIQNSGYEMVSLWMNNRGKSLLVHRIVASAFLGSQPQMDVNHKDGCKTNNVLSNLEWTTRKINVNHAFKRGLASNNHSRKLILNVETGIFYNGVSEANKAMGSCYCDQYFGRIVRGESVTKLSFIQV